MKLGSRTTKQCCLLRQRRRLLYATRILWRLLRTRAHTRACASGRGRRTASATPPPPERPAGVMKRGMDRAACEIFVCVGLYVAGGYAMPLELTLAARDNHAI